MSQVNRHAPAAVRQTPGRPPSLATQSSPMNKPNHAGISGLRATHVACARLGIIGGGQLAGMTGRAAQSLGCEVMVLERDAVCPAARLGLRLHLGDWNDRETLIQFARQVDVITLENEFVDAASLRWLEECGHKVFPTSASLALIQDKFMQKETLGRAGLPGPGFQAVNSGAEVLAAAEDLGWPLVLKARRNGYDGKGNFTLRSAEDVPVGWKKLGGGDGKLFVEAFWNFRHELAVIVTRGCSGDRVTYPVVETIQRDHVCHRVQSPAALSPELAVRATELANRAVTAVGGVGSFGVELFLSAGGELALNELAPRVHNSGHYTIEACECSQFENHVRAVLGWPLGSPRMTAPAAAMCNVLGRHRASGRPRGLPEALSVVGAHVHLYGKALSEAGRKMGHVTALGQTVDEATATAERAARALHFGTIDEN